MSAPACCHLHDVEQPCGREDVCCADCPTPAGLEPEDEPPAKHSTLCELLIFNRQCTCRASGGIG